MSISSTVRAFATFVFCTPLLLALPNVVLAHGGDVWLYTDAASSELAVGLADEAGGTFTPGESVFESILTADTLPFSSFDWSATEPGFRAAAGELPASQPISLTAGPLLHWEGSSLVATSDVSFSFNLSGGFGSEPNGSLHDHAPMGLTSMTASPVPDGVYVASIRAAVAGLGESSPFYLVMLKDDLIASEDDAEELAELLEAYEEGGPAPVFGGKDFSFLEEAVEFVEAIPEPNSFALAAVGVALLGTRRRRR